MLVCSLSVPAGQSCNAGTGYRMSELKASVLGIVVPVSWTLPQNYAAKPSQYCFVNLRTQFLVTELGCSPRGCIPLAMVAWKCGVIVIESNAVSVELGGFGILKGGGGGGGGRY
jgi:hypothetical protein